ncbi:PREDICTED: transmembrane protein 141, partial [Phaethon lepturus]|uniref:transmembrane protein 141 n=1 Tax=Phaethon lepturus TaxID=97097 RepID=UPI0005308BD4
RGGSGAAAGAFPTAALTNALAAGILGSIFVSPASGSLASYVVTRAETQKCSDFWIYLETGKSPQELTMAARVSQPTENLPSPEDRESVAPPVRRNNYGDVVE